MINDIPKILPLLAQLGPAGANEQKVTVLKRFLNGYTP